MKPINQTSISTDDQVAVPRDRTILLFGGLLLMALIVYYCPWLEQKATFFISDHGLFFEPLCRYIGGRLAQGSFPLWNPLLGCGQSQVAIASPSLFYPPNLLFCLWPYSVCVAGEMIFHQLLAGLGMYLIIERLRWGQAAAATGGLVLVLSGYMFSLSQNFTIVFTAAWVPLCVYSVMLLDDRRSLKRIIGCLLLSFSIYMMLASGRPEIWSIALLVLLVVAALILWQKRGSGKHLLSTLGLILSAGICAILIAMPVVLPPAEWAWHSPRALTWLAGDILSWSGTWYDLLSILLGQPLGAAYDYTNPYVWLIHPIGSALPFVASSFLGPVALTLAFTGMCDRSFGYRWLVFGFLLLAIVVTLGKNTLLMPFLIQHIAQLSFLRIPIKFMFFIHLATALLAARGVNFLSGQSQHQQRPMRLLTALAGFWAGSAVLGCGMCLFPHWGWLGLSNFFEHYVHQFAAGAIKQIGAYLSIWSLIGLLAVALMAASVRRSKVGSAALTCLLVLLGLSMVVSAGMDHTAALSDPNFYGHRSFAADVINLANAGNPLPARILTILPVPPSPRRYHELNRPININASMQYERQVLSGNTCLDYNIGSLFPYEGALTKECQLLRATLDANILSGAIGDLTISRVCQATTTDFLVTEIDQTKPMVPPGQRYFKIVAELPALDIRVYQTRNPLPFAYFCTRCAWLPASVTIQDMATAERSGFDPHEGVVLCRPFDTSQESNVPVSVDRPQPAATVPPGPVIRPARILNYRPERIELAVDAPVEGALVINDQLYPGWRAMVDGKPVPILRANGLFKAVLVKSGRHEVVFFFESDSLRLGLLLSGLGLLLLAALVLGLKFVRPCVR